ncbi:hypothetical protein AOL_s00210g2 [Orbilia oligospora ATCC 24927]|uniref:Uncharacterized protein n=1 Tax=Arthrobotrys oligospora (strain ATCC 24927 / CBS 115.81 / DSM 1491) TaxID=756982 RepID=G1XRJ4_ARTOA|nr:hypothetical protein AOL_s00210g2 [Orbilia oligospora ATCC 24927]EGX44213.1 hypothetical protein AOL_s00210g2 [Orbilia oligospora ATCC 24927]
MMNFEEEINQPMIDAWQIPTCNNSENPDFDDYIGILNRVPDSGGDGLYESGIGALPDPFLDVDFSNLELEPFEANDPSFQLLPPQEVNWDPLEYSLPSSSANLVEWEDSLPKTSSPQDVDRMMTPSLTKGVLESDSDHNPGSVSPFKSGTEIPTSNQYQLSQDEATGIYISPAFQTECERNIAYNAPGLIYANQLGIEQMGFLDALPSQDQVPCTSIYGPVSAPNEPLSCHTQQNSITYDAKAFEDDAQKRKRSDSFQSILASSDGEPLAKRSRGRPRTHPLPLDAEGNPIQPTRKKAPPKHTPPVKPKVQGSKEISNKYHRASPAQVLIHHSYGSPPRYLSGNTCRLLFSRLEEISRNYPQCQIQVVSIEEIKELDEILDLFRRYFDYKFHQNKAISFMGDWFVRTIEGLWFAFSPGAERFRILKKRDGEVLRIFKVGKGLTGNYLNTEATIAMAVRQREKEMIEEAETREVAA